MGGRVVTVENASSPTARAEAAAWLGRLHADDRSTVDERAFQAWLAADPSHARAFEEMTATWDLVGGLRHVPREEATLGRTLLRRRAVLAGLGTLVVAGAGLGAWQRAFAGVYETDVGEQKHIALDDGTQVFLDTDTRIRARFSDTARTVELERGRCNFHVVPDATRPFVVDAAGQRIVAARTNLDVRCDGDRVSVVLLQGTASFLEQKGLAHKEKALRPGERAVAMRGGLTIDRPSLAPLLAWQTGQALFESETLAQAVTEMNRYSALKLEIDDPAIAQLRLSGVYRVGDNVAFARSVATLLPVEARFAQDTVQFVADPTRMPQG
jgi:transmembrane sensor